MKANRNRILLGAVGALLLLIGPPAPRATPESAASFIVQGSDVERVVRLVESVGGKVTHELGIIDAVGATLTPSQAGALETLSGIRRVYGNHFAAVAGKPAKGGGGGGGETDVCAASGGHLLSFPNSITAAWDLSNTGNVDLTIDSIYLNWTADSGRLGKIKLKRSEIFDGDRQPPLTTINSGWAGTANDRRIPAGRSTTLKLGFPEGVDARQSAFAISIDFVEGCSVAYQPGANPGTSFPDGYEPDTFFPRRIDADRVWAQGVTGYGVGVAVLDTSTKRSLPGIKADTLDVGRVRAHYDAINDALCLLEEDVSCGGDVHGHGTHVAGVVLNSRITDFGDFGGIAPDAGLVVVRALGDDGSGSYADVIRGIDWVVDNKDVHDIRVLNLSLSAPVRSHYWEDPLNQAVMAAWRAGIVVVASAGNTGPDPMTIGVPGNNPYVITVGAMSDGYSSLVPSDDFLTSFSATGPTHEGFVKPELVAPGGHIISKMQSDTVLSDLHLEYRFGDQYFQMSGTSQAAAVVSGVVALMLEQDPGLSPDDVKCRLMASARPAVDAAGELAYSVFQQGTGLVNAYDAVFGSASGCANRGLDVDLDLAGLNHYAGLAREAEDGGFYLAGHEGFVWNEGFVWGEGFVWSEAFVWSDGFVWGDAFIWTDSFIWSDTYAFNDAFVWSSGLTETMSVNTWVEQE